MSAAAPVPESYREDLSRLVALDTVSPLDAPRREACARELRRHGCGRVGDGIFGRGDPAAPVWLYTHVDTKPVGPRAEWATDPFRLTAVDDRWYGLGISDSKFQLLNALRSADRRRHFVLVDTSEEHDGDGEAAAYLAAGAPRTLLICDGARDEADVYSGYRGQADGYVHLDTGRPTHHPARPGGDVAQALSDLLDAARGAGLRFTLTGLSAPATERSLALQRAAVRFDIRFDPAEETAVRDFLARWPHELRQWIWPVASGAAAQIDGLVCGGTAPFSNRLGAGRPLGVGRVLVVPGADPDNRNHNPNEFIRPAQVGRHLATLGRVLRSTGEDQDG